MVFHFTLIERLGKSWESVLIKIGYIYPLSPFRGVIWHMLDKSSNSLLDVGCGEGGVGLTVRLRSKKKNYLVGVDLYIPHLRLCKSRTIYDDVVLCDVRFLPFKDKSCDAVIAVEIIEHLTKKDGLLLIKELERLARKQVLMSTPCGFTEMFLHGVPKNYDSLKAQLLRHKAGWLPSKFRKMGYEVRGNFGPSFLPVRFAYYLSFIFPITYLQPELAHDMVASKRLYGD